jgi:hypothetical protein
LNRKPRGRELPALAISVGRERVAFTFNASFRTLLIHIFIQFVVSGAPNVAQSSSNFLSSLGDGPEESVKDKTRCSNCSEFGIECTYDDLVKVLTLSNYSWPVLTSFLP